ncbi:MFS transporter [Nocardioides bigeumensis]|uniref:MFS transporter n=1 Tax=Nocardioides bigeumensis TaxID=433657 RepID=A0ABP5JX02_9ACTN
MTGPTTGAGTTSSQVLVARNAVAVVFALNGLCFATWVSRIPEVRDDLGLTNGRLGLLLLAIAAGSVLAMPTTGALINRFGTIAVTRFGLSSAVLGLVTAAMGASEGIVPLTALGLFAYGVGTGVWDVAMNVEGAAVERGLGRTIMPRFHAGFSLGTVLGAGVGALVIWLGLPMLAHLGGVAVLAFGVVWTRARSFLPVEPEPEGGHSSAWTAWREPRTLLIGLMVFALALTEGTANDWLALALVDGYDVAHWVGVTGFALFVTAMTLGRLLGTQLLDRFGRLAVLWSTMAAAAGGVVLIVYGGAVGAVAGIALWGVGASLGFPVGMSAAADDPIRAAARVSVVSTIGYGAFLGGPPLLGFVADRVGTLEALLVVAVLLVPSALVVPAAREPGR